MHVLNAFSRNQPELSLAALSALVGIDKVIVHRMLKTMMEGGVVEQDHTTKQYRLGPKVGDFAAVRRSMVRPVEHAVDLLLSVHEKTDETVHLAQLEDEFVIVTFSVSSTQGLRVVMSVGERLPFYCTGPGLLYLAYADAEFREIELSRRMRRRASGTITDRKVIESILPDIRKKGIAIVDSTYSDGSKAITAPIFNKSGQLIAAASVLGPSIRLQGKDETRVETMIVNAAQQISKRHGYQTKRNS